MPYTFVLLNTVWFTFIRRFEISEFIKYTSYNSNSINIFGYWESERIYLEANLVKSLWNWQLVELLEPSSKAAMLYLVEIYGSSFLWSSTYYFIKSFKIRCQWVCTLNIFENFGKWVNIFNV